MVLGTGKTATIMNYLKGLPKEEYLSNVVNCSARTTAQQMQELVMAKLDRRRKGVFGPPVGKRVSSTSCLCSSLPTVTIILFQSPIFVDDVAMPALDRYGAQPPLELIRQWLNHGYWSDLKDASKIELVDLVMIFSIVPFL